MRGSSAIANLLEQIHDQNLRILVVWEPILPTDWRKPTSGTLARISDSRAVQFWDPHHLVSGEIQRSFAPNRIALVGHTSGGHIWDFALLYAPAFNDALPAPVFAGGPVVDVASQLGAKIRQLLNPASAAALSFSDWLRAA